MDMNKRIYLQKGDKIRLMRGSSRSVEEWLILGSVSEGASSVCYQAACGNKIGRLKEFYPIYIGKRHSVILKRNQNYQLFPYSDSMAENYRRMCLGFVAAYEKLEHTKKADEQNQVLNNYIPPYEVLYGYDESGAAGSVYIWTPDDKKGKEFDVFLSEVRRYPQRRAEWKLYQILNTILTLTDCVKALHQAGLLHLDLKPSNFLVPYTSDMALNTNTISLFDVNTLYDVDGTIPPIVGTKGFCAPEVLKGRAENRSDIYSIGAILFQAIVMDEVAPDGIYQDEFYPYMEQFVSDSKLICSSSVNSNVFLKYWLVTILKKCLVKRPANRYGSCEELIADLEKVKTFLTPSISKGKLGENRKIIVVEQEINRPQWIFHQMLYKDPLYRRVQEGEAIEVLVVGAGNYGQKFMDVCLQMGQMLNHDLHITALSAEPELDKKVYLQFRPALARFVDVDGSLCGNTEQAYGKICFQQCRFVVTEQQKNNEKAEGILKKNPYQYVFISLGDDELNEGAAEAFALSAKKLGMHCAVHFVVQEGQNKEYTGGEPVYLNAKITAKKIDTQLERMAFLTHTCWNGFDGDQKMLRKQFQQKYNYESSLSYALSVFYKLHSIGIETDDLNRAADSFYDIILRDKTSHNTLFQKLTALEHRRWVLEKVTNGWSAPLDANGNLDLTRCVKKGNVKDSIGKLHPCIVRSTENTPLLKPPYCTNEGDVWEQPNPQDETLDELDRVSVELHRYFKEQRDVFCKTAPLQRGDLAILRTMLSHERVEVKETYQQYQMCLKDILSGSKTASKQYPYLENKLMGSLDQSSIREEVKLRLEQISREFFPVVEYNLYRNYKLYDEVLIEKIPFILTYQPYPYLGMPYFDENGYVWELYKAAAELKPKKITVFAYLSKKIDLDRFIQRMHVTVGRLKERQIQSKISFVIAVKDVADAENRVKAALKVAEQIEVFSVFDEVDALQQLKKALKGKRIDLFWDGEIFSDKMEEKWKGILQQKGLSAEGVKEYMKYQESSAFMRCSDIFHMLGQPLPKPFYPEFAEEYGTLWNVRKNYGKKQWGDLCLQLSQAMKKQDLLVQCSLQNVQEHTLIYYFPYFGYSCVSDFVGQLKASGLVSEKSAVISHTSDTGRVEMITSYALKEIMDAVFANPYVLFEENGLSLFVEGKSISVSVNQLVVKGLLLAEDKQYQVLEELQALHLINGLHEIDGKVGFVFSSFRVKRMMTDKDQILRTYAYYEIKRNHRFDDVLWTKDGCIMTKGFEAFFVEIHNISGKIHAMADILGRGKKLCMSESDMNADDVTTVPLDHIEKTITNLLEGI